MRVSRLRWAFAAIAVVPALASACGSADEVLAGASVEAAPRSAAVDAALRRVDARFGTALARPPAAEAERRLVRAGAVIVAAWAPEALAVELPAAAGGPTRVEDPSGTVAVAFALEGEAAAVRAEISGGRAAWFGGGGASRDVLVRVTHTQVEDWVQLRDAPSEPSLVYRLDVSRVAGLRLVGGGLELLDAAGTPRLRVAPPWVADARGARHDARLTLEGCAADRDASAPWGRPVTAPGARACALRVSWPRGLAVPLLVDPSWQATANTMSVPRGPHAAVTLGDGRVLVAGNCGTDCTTAELYDPATRTFALTGATVVAHETTTHGALLTSGKVLLTSGKDGFAGPSRGELYTPGTGTFALTGTHGGSVGDVLVALPNGRALYMMGAGAGNAYEFDPTLAAGAGDFVLLAATSHAGDNVGAVALADGSVAVTGGLHSYYVFPTSTWVHARQAATSIYDPTTRAFTPGPALVTGRHQHAMARLADGRVLVAGGNVGGTSDEFGSATASVEVWTPPGGAWTSAGTLALARQGLGAIALPTRAIFLGGLTGPFGGATSAVDLFPNGAAAPSAGPSLGSARALPGVALAGGTALATAGGSGPSAQNAELYVGLAGEACQLAGECGSGFCVDGVCCDTACTGPCTACTAGRKGSGADGGCGPIAAGADPDSECADQGAASCGTDGACDGAGQCRRYLAGTECVAGTCVDTTRTLSGTCSTVSVCVAGATVSCEPYACGSGALCRTTCSQASHCAPNAYCTGGACLPKKSLGGACASATECTLGFCIDGVCCDRACDGECEACRDDLKQSLAGSGSCDAARAGTDPHDTCALGTGCGNDGSCDGAGACRKAVLGTACGATACIDATTVAGQICNGAGQCISDSTGTSCGEHLCKAGACALPCASDTDCVANAYCAAPDCVERAAAGAPCASNAACQSGFCSRDQVCCDSACQGVCEACSAAAKGAGASGACGPITAGNDPFDDCGDTGAASCDTDGSCDGAGACARYPEGFACDPASCVAGAARTFGCAAGSCVANDTPCGANGCAAGACLTGCSADGDCASSAYCEAGQCVPRAATGVACTDARTCASGHCVDGVCCTTACGGQCEACDLPTATGTCSPVNGDPHGARPSCAGSSAGEDVCAARTCEGSKSTSICSGYVGLDVECRPQSCVDGVETFREPCDGTGQCPAARTRKCFPFACGATTCLDSCSADSECASGARCDRDDGRCATALTCEGSVLTSPDGQSKDCAPYACDDVEGCLVACTTTEQCTPGNVCDPSSGRCVPGASPSAADEGGCACRLPSARGPRGSLAAVLGALLVAAAAVRRRGLRPRPRGARGERWLGSRAARER